MTRSILLTCSALLLTACDAQSGGNATTKLDAVEVEPGTASDAMIMLDDSDVDGTAVDNSAVLTAEGQAAAKAEAAKAVAVDPSGSAEVAADETAEDTKAAE